MAVPVENVVTKPVEAQAVRFDGSFDSSEFLKTWVRSSTKGQKIFVQDEKTISIQGSNGTFDILEGWWLVRQKNGVFEVFEDQTFRQIYMIKGKRI